MKTLYVSDLDGTLLTREDRLTPRTAQTLNRLMAEGMCFTYATARSIHSASVVAAGLDPHMPVIVYNGAFTLRADTGEILASCTFSPEERACIRGVLDACGISPLVYGYVEGRERVSWRTDRENDGIRRYLSKRTADRRMRPAAGDGIWEGDIFYYTCIGEREALLPVYEVLREETFCNCILQQELYRPEYWCEIMPREATKAHAVLRLKERLGCDRVVSFGDAVNDLPMFRVSDECYAVENAVPALKEVATAVIAGNEADGVARFLEERWARQRE